jgi:ribosomal protein L22
MNECDVGNVLRLSYIYTFSCALLFFPFHFFEMFRSWTRLWTQVRCLHQSIPIHQARPDQHVSPIFQSITKQSSEIVKKLPEKPESVLLLQQKKKKDEDVVEFQVSTSNFKTSTRKLRFLADQIVGLDVQEAIDQMEFSKKKAAKKILGTLALGRNNAHLQKNMDKDKLYVARAWVGKGKYLRRIRYHARGRFGVMHHPTAHMKIVLREREPEPDIGRARRRDIRGWHVTKKVWMALQDKPIYNPKPYYNW